ncbi:hypothetical protein BJV77DRAFT_967099 [Russula vinacea]|nr:hypothetical protein BJV77DRAFT_967099 [Russula vinacea]
MKRVWQAHLKNCKSYSSKNRQRAPPLAISEAHCAGLAIILHMATSINTEDTLNTEDNGEDMEKTDEDNEDDREQSEGDGDDDVSIQEINEDGDEDKGDDLTPPAPPSDLPGPSGLFTQAGPQVPESQNSSLVIATTQLVPNANTTPVIVPNADTTPVTLPGPQPSHEAVGVRSHQTRKANVLSLNTCICGLTITDREIKDSKAVMKCRVPGYETVWFHMGCIDYDFVPWHWSCESCRAGANRRRCY